MIDKFCFIIIFPLKKFSTFKKRPEQLTKEKQRLNLTVLSGGGTRKLDVNRRPISGETYIYQCEGKPSDEKLYSIRLNVLDNLHVLQSYSFGYADFKNFIILLQLVKLLHAVMSDYEVHVLHEGYSTTTTTGSLANCTCTLIKGKNNIIVDTMTPWDKDFILEKLAGFDLMPKNINFVVSTHGHSDHCGNNNLFLDAVHIMGYSISHKNFYDGHSFEHQGNYKIDDYVEIIPTPGHMLAHVSVSVITNNNEIVVVAGDLFENENDINDESIWKEAGSENEEIQSESRKKILDMADYIIPGHGKMFKVKKG